MEQKAINKELQLAIIEAKYNEKVKRTIRRYRERTMGELWQALDKLKDKMRAEMEEYGLNDVKLVSKDEKLLTKENVVKADEN